MVATGHPVTVVSGVPGVGASHVCEGARREVDSVTLVNVGDVMLETALERGLTNSRDELGTLSVRDQRELQRRAGEYLARKAADGPLLVNTHFVVRTDSGFLPGLDPTMLSDIDPDRFVVIDASTETILDRRADSQHRQYGADTLAAVDFQRQLQTAAASTYSFQTGAPVQYVHNEGDIDESVAELVAVLEGLAD
jgi:adenylate kinase